MNPLILAVLPLIGILLVSGCTGSTTGGFTGSLAGSGGNTQLTDEVSSQPEVPADVSGPQAPEAGAHLDVASVKTDKGLYHSAEVMKITAVVNAEDAVTGAVITATGVGGKMSLSQTVDLSAGGNEVEFSYQLPRCNVCDGIPAGTYTCTLSASGGDASSSQDFSVELAQ